MKTPEEIKKGLECCLPRDEEECGSCPYSGLGCCDTRIKDTLAYIQQLEASAPKWISVKKKLPKRGTFVLFQYAKDAQNPTMHARNTMAVGRYDYGMFIVEGCSVKVTHWMPLPEPPKEDARG